MRWRGLELFRGIGRCASCHCSLIEVSRTAPYFRDGSVANLDDAVRMHVGELREIGRERDAIAANPDALLRGVDLRVKVKPRVALSDPAKKQLGSETWIPASLDRNQLDDLVAFLRSLSPRLDRRR
jgi:cytochrome c peroxidase